MGRRKGVEKEWSGGSREGVGMQGGRGSGVGGVEREWGCREGVESGVRGEKGKRREEGERREGLGACKAGVERCDNL